MTTENVVTETKLLCQNLPYLRLEPDAVKAASPVLRGLPPSNGGWLLDN